MKTSTKGVIMTQAYFKRNQSILGVDRQEIHFSNKNIGG